jgi:hypothetical protein
MLGSRIRASWSAGALTRCIAGTLPPIVGVALLLASISSPHCALAGGVVGTGSASSCSETALDAALSGGGSITFDCGGTVTVRLTATKVIATDTSINGAGMVTLSGRASDALPICPNSAVGTQYFCDRLLSVEAGVALTLENLTLANSAGGALSTNGGTLTIANSTFANNVTWANQGGAIYIAGGTATITNSTFVNNRTRLGDVAAGGAIYIGSGTATITSSSFSGNSVPCGVILTQVASGSGGAIANGGALTIANSTFSDNLIQQQSPIGCDFSTSAGAIANGAVYYQGGPIAFQAGSVKVINSTFSNSNGLGAGVTISNPSSGSVIVTNSIIAATLGRNCTGAVSDGGHNLQFPSADCGATIGVADPLLAPVGLTYNGGPTQTIALQPGSPAINNGNDAVCAAGPVGGFDQRGFARPGTGHLHCSIGALEFYFPPTPSNTPGADVDCDGVPAGPDNCPLAYNPDQRDTDGDGVGDTCDDCPAVLNPAQSDLNGDEIGDLCDDTAPVPTPLLLRKVKLKATSPNRGNGTIRVQGTFDASELVDAFGSLDAALEGGATVGVIGVGFVTAQRIAFPASMCSRLGGTIRCVGSGKETVKFRGTGTGNLFDVRITARKRSFQPALTPAGVQVILSIGGLDRQDQIPSCKVSTTGRTATCKK